MTDHRTCVLDLTDTRMSCVTVAGLSAYSLVNLVAGGHTNATGNSAARGGAAALVDASLIVQPGHKVTAQRNAAHSHGGAFALLAGGSLALLEAAACPTRCLSSSRGGGFCDHECMVASCNWDGGDCVNTRMDAAGKEAGQVCDRAKCSIFWQTNAGAIVNEWVCFDLFHCSVRLEPRALRRAQCQCAQLPARRRGGLRVHQDGAAVTPSPTSAFGRCFESLCNFESAGYCNDVN